jgi:hypothetical protein
MHIRAFASLHTLMSARFLAVATDILASRKRQAFDAPSGQDILQQEMDAPGGDDSELAVN